MILIHEWTPDTHVLAILPAQVEELTGALNYPQTFIFEAVSAISAGHPSPLSRAPWVGITSRWVSFDRAGRGFGTIIERGKQRGAGLEVPVGLEESGSAFTFRTSDCSRFGILPSGWSSQREGGQFSSSVGASQQ